MASVQISVQTDVVKNIACGTAGGVLLSFQTIEVVNRLHKSSVIPTIKKYGLLYGKASLFCHF